MSYEDKLNPDLIKCHERYNYTAQVPSGFVNPIEDNSQERLIKAVNSEWRALWALADHMIPADIVDSAKRWKMEETIKELWRSAFIEGWRSAIKANGRES